jgi:hypothetical protein
VHVQPTVGPTSINAPVRSLYTARFPCCASDAGTLTATEAGSDVVVVETPEVVWQTTTGRVAVTIVPEPEPFVAEVELEVEPDAAVVGVAGADVLDVVPCFGWFDPVDEAGPDDPHAAKRNTTDTTAPARPNVR